ncbi:MAG: hypothetical protein KAV83_12655 [Desulfobacterales bacterium]|nr:hypothetical protein [Desulfobacterales bacterium]
MSDYGARGSSVWHIPRENENDCQIIHTDANHVCIMKLCPAADADPSIPVDDHRRFHIRYYIPRFVLDTKNSNVENLVRFAHNWNIGMME